MAGNVSPLQAWRALMDDPSAQLVDVRTPAEWQHVGVPVLAEAGRAPILLSWQFADGRPNPAFVAGLRQAGLQDGQKLYFLCRSGVRSQAAAEAAEAAGYATCLNVETGFEGPPDAQGRRGTLSGWQADGLPWTV